MIEMVYVPICVELGGMQLGSLLPSYVRVQGESSVNTVFPPLENGLCP